MNLLEECLNDRLEHVVQRAGSAGPQISSLRGPAPISAEHTSQIEELIALARRLQQTPQVQASPEFVRQLERRLRLRNAELRQQERQQRSPLLLLRARPLRSAVLGLCVLLCLLGAGVLALAAQASTPGNPLYSLNLWERHMRVQLSGGPADQATLDLQLAREQLAALPGLAGPTHTEAYRQALRELDQQVNAAATAIAGLPAGSAQGQLADELAGLKSDAIHLLRSLLSRLALPERLETTGELGQLGDTVPLLVHARVLLPAHPNGQATISLQGSNLQSGAQLLINGVPVKGNSTKQTGQLVFLVPWKGEQHPQSLGLLNPDGTAVQTTAIAIIGSTNGNPNGKGNQPTSTPTPHGNKPPVTPTPHGNQSEPLAPANW